MSIIQKLITFTTFQRLVNQKKISALFGWLSNLHLPPIILKKIIQNFIKNHQIDMSQYDFDINSVKCFNEFFIRRLKPNKRTFEGDVCAGADGFISAFGAIENNQLFQVKGRNYPLNVLLNQKQSFENGSFITIYLSLADYHRVHMPFDGIITEVKKISGKLFSVNKKTINTIDQVYCQNERVVLKGTGKFGEFYMVMVGAIVVGKIKLSITNINMEFDKSYPLNISLKQGDEVGYFELGSTLLVVMESDVLATLKFEEYQKIYLGNKIC